MLGQNVVPFPGGGLAAPPPMMPNPDYQQWQQMQQAWVQEVQKREQMFMDACEYIKKDATKRYNIDIEADSTIAPDQEAEKASRTQFLQAITPFMEAALPLAAANPAAGPLVKALIMFAVNGFSVSRQLQDEFETALDAMMKNPSPPVTGKGGGKSPQETQAEIAVKQGEQQKDLKVAQINAQSQQQERAVDLMELYARIQADQQKLAAQQQTDAAKLGLEQRKAATQEALGQARLSHYATRDEKGLV